MEAWKCAGSASTMFPESNENSINCYHTQYRGIIMAKSIEGKTRKANEKAPQTKLIKNLCLIAMKISPMFIFPRNLEMIAKHIWMYQTRSQFPEITSADTVDEKWRQSSAVALNSNKFFRPSTVNWGCMKSKLFQSAKEKLFKFVSFHSRRHIHTSEIYIARWKKIEVFTIRFVFFFFAFLDNKLNETPRNVEGKNAGVDRVKQNLTLLVDLIKTEAEV